MSPTVDIISPKTDLGEGPHWDETTQSLYFVDILKSTIHRFVPETNQYTFTKIEIPGQEVKPVSIIIPVKNEKNKFVITHGTDVVKITWDGVNKPSEYQILATASEDDNTVTRINDGKCSPSGVLFAANRRPVFNLRQNNIEAFPDGMTIDVDGNLWVACWGSGQVAKIDPKTGTLLDTVSLPTSNITSVAFGGKNLDELYVTSASIEIFENYIKEGDTTAGCTFKVTGIGYKGIAGVPIDLSSQN